MTPDKMTCSREMGLALQERGVTVESLFSHYHCDNADIVTLTVACCRNDRIIAPAYTVAELGEMLPSEVKGRALYYSLKIQNYHGKWMSWYENEYWDSLNEKTIVGHSEADNRAKMLLWLIDNGHLKVEYINEN